MHLESKISVGSSTRGEWWGKKTFFFLVLLAQKERKYNNNTMSVYRLLSLAKKDVHKKFIKQ